LGFETTASRADVVGGAARRRWSGSLAADGSRKSLQSSVSVATREHSQRRKGIMGFMLARLQSAQRVAPPCKVDASDALLLAEPPDPAAPPPKPPPLTPAYELQAEPLVEVASNNTALSSRPAVPASCDQAVQCSLPWCATFTASCGTPREATASGIDALRGDSLSVAPADADLSSARVRVAVRASFVGSTVVALFSGLTGATRVARRDASTQAQLKWLSHDVRRAPMPRVQRIANAWIAVDAYWMEQRYGRALGRGG
jgi:hypothetical protein